MKAIRLQFAGATFPEWKFDQVINFDKPQRDPVKEIVAYLVENYKAKETAGPGWFTRVLVPKEEIEKVREDLIKSRYSGSDFSQEGRKGTIYTGQKGNRILIEKDEWKGGKVYAVEVWGQTSNAPQRYQEEKEPKPKKEPKEEPKRSFPNFPWDSGGELVVTPFKPDLSGGFPRSPDRMTKYREEDPDKGIKRTIDYLVKNYGALKAKPGAPLTSPSALREKKFVKEGGVEVLYDSRTDIKRLLIPKESIEELRKDIVKSGYRGSDFKPAPDRLEDDGRLATFYVSRAGGRLVLDKMPVWRGGQFYAIDIWGLTQTRRYYPREPEDK